MAWIHESSEWDGWFRFDADALPLPDVGRLEDSLSARMAGLDAGQAGFLRLAVIEREVLANSRIEGIRLPEEAVRSALSRRLGVPLPIREASARDARDCVEVMADAVGNHVPADLPRLLSWQSGFVGGGMAGLRDGGHDMRVVSGPVGFEKVHYVAPSGEKVAGEMENLLGRLKTLDAHPIVKAGLAHLGLVLVHPFPDGNGRTARTLSCHILARARPDIGAFAGMSGSVLADSREYGRILDKVCRQDGMDVTEWLEFVCRKRLESLASADFDKIVGQCDFLRRAENLGYDGNVLSVLYRVSRPDFRGRVDTRKLSLFMDCPRDDADFLLERLEADGLMRKVGKSWEPILEPEDDFPKP